jgi:cell volume regulation protein A
MTSIITIICLLLLFAYVFDISASKTKIPAVVLLLLLGYLVKQATIVFEISVPDLTTILPSLGTVGLILIVLEGSLELELNKSKLPFVGKTALMALLPMLVFSFGLAYLFHYFSDASFKFSLANAIPLAVISSAIAIPSAQNLISKEKEFITYESSLSDIFGVVFFNFITLNNTFEVQSFGIFGLQIVVILIISFIATLGLAYLLSKINHHVKFTPIILMIVLIYSISKEYHLPGLVFILLFGLFLGNLDELKHIKFIQKLQPQILNKETHKFKELTTEIAFLIRAIFFILFGFLIETNELFNSETIIWASGICAGIYLIRFIFLRSFRFKSSALLFIAPRGLITILLFLNVPLSQTINLANKSLIIQVIILSALIMMLGLMFSTKKNPETEEEIGVL